METSENNLLSKNILDALSSHIAIIDSDGTIQYVNKAWRDFALLNDGEIDKLGKGTNYLGICEQALDIAPSEEAVSALQGLHELLHGKREKFELTYPCHSPSQRRWFLMRCSRMTSGSGLIVISHIDITKQKESEEALREGEVRYRSLFMHAPDAILTSRIVLPWSTTPASSCLVPEQPENFSERRPTICFMPIIIK